MSRQAVNALLQVREQSRYLRVLTLTLGYQHEFFPYTIRPRDGGARITTWRAEITTAIDLLAANSATRCAGHRGGLVRSLPEPRLCVLCGGDLPAQTRRWRRGGPRLSLQLSGMFFFVCLILAVLSEYVGTILGEVRSRPLYFIAQEANSSVLLEDTVQSSIVKDSVV